MAGGPIIQSSDIESTFRAIRNRNPQSLREQNIPYTPDYKQVPYQNYAPTASVSGAFGGNGMYKYASSSANAGMIYGQPQFFSPVHTPINWQIPQKRIECYQWSRFFYENEPKVASSIDFYSYFPMNGFDNECKERKIKKYFDKLRQRLDLEKWLRLVSHEVHLLGDCFPFLEISCEHCFPADTMILTQDGHKRIQDIKVGDSVLTIERSYEEVIKTMSFKYEGQMTEITLQSLPNIKSTSDHKHYIVRPEYRPDNRIKTVEWDKMLEVEAKDICEGDYVACPFNDILKNDIDKIHFNGSQYRFINKSLGKQIDILLDDDFARLMGWYVAEGSTDSNRKFSFSLSIDEMEYASQIKGWLEKYFEQGSEVTPRWVGNVSIVSGYSRELSAWLDDHCGHGAKNKKIPYFIMRATKSIKKSFLDAYLLGDGYTKDSANTNSLSTVSRTLCYDLVALLADLGYSCYVDEKEECVDNLGIHRCHCYRINYRIESKRENGQGTHKEDNRIFFKVKGVKTSDEKTVVYNFTVDKNHNYVANFCHTKNCGGSGKIGDQICEHEGGTVRRVVILNPDYVEVYTSPINPDPVIALKPDEELINMVQKKTPGYERLTPEVRALVSAGRPIPLDNRNVFHLKYGEGGYTRYGIGMVRRLFPILSYKTKLMVAQWIVAERLIVPIRVVKVGNDDRPAGPADIASVQEQLAQTANDPNLTIVTHNAFELDWYGACYSSDTEVLTENGWKKYEDVSKNFDEKVATYNVLTNKMEYQVPQEYHQYDYDGEMVSFSGKHYDCLVTPNHRMLASVREWDNKKNKYSHSGWKITRADQVGENSRFKTTIDWEGSIPTQAPYKSDYLVGDLVSLHDYLKFVGYYLSEGGLKIQDGVINAVGITQKENSPFFDEIKSAIYKVSSKIQKSEDTRSDPSCWTFYINDSKFAREMAVNFGDHSYNKFIPRWILDLPKSSLCVLLNSLIDGDGNTRVSESGKIRFKYTTTSKQLSDDVQEIVFKLGYDPKVSIQKSENENHNDIYLVYWSNEIKNKNSRAVKDRNISREIYKGKVWCFTVPNGVFVTRRNGKISIHGNSGKVLTLSNEFEMINQEILDGMMINNALLNGEGPNFSNAAVGIEAMIERLQTFRKEVSNWVEQKIYLPEAKRQGFVDEEVDQRDAEEDGEDEYVYPRIKWHSMHLRDQQQHRTFVLQLYEKGLLSAQTVLETFDFDPDQEIERKRWDAVQMMALGQGMGEMGVQPPGGGGEAGGMGGGFGGMPSMPGGEGGGGGGLPGMEGGGGGGAAGSPISAPAAGGGAPPAMSTSKVSLATSAQNISTDQGPANPTNYGGRILKQRTREKLDMAKQKMYREVSQSKEDIDPSTLPGMRDMKGRIVFTKPERQLMEGLSEYKKNGLIKYPIVPQYAVKFGSTEYPIDFALPNLKLGIEADGEVFHSSPKQVSHDKERDMKLTQSGWTILRFKDSEIDKRLERVMSTIVKNIMQKEALVKRQEEQLK